MELYNEELKDLLSPENDFRKLKLFEDLNRKGSVVVQGLEEILVKNAEDVIGIMQKGTLKRQIAATKMNETSSRSHGIFSITVHIKESTPDGEELLKVGKLNLVDLAGSENIQRSGAENKRAKEAGMINQSLLTLGRVINALVERSPHVPYRESKLTRILQDSLGGKTKTCIIAALSPARCNIEESLSTLDYAHRAKNIRNKPEVNQKMTKRALIREYVSAIDRLKADLQAAREKNGIYLSPETYHTLVNENQGQKDQIDEVAKVLEAKEEQIASLEAKFNEKMTLLTQTSAQLEETMAELVEKQQALKAYMEETQMLQNRLAEQQYITQAHAATESELDQLAQGLVSTLQSSTKDISGLHEKLDRKTALEIQNLHSFSDLQQSLCGHFQKMEQSITAFQLQAQSYLEKVDQGVTLQSDQTKGLIKQVELEQIRQSDALVQDKNELVFQMRTQTQELQQDVNGMFDLGQQLVQSVKQGQDNMQQLNDQMISEWKTLTDDLMNQTQSAWKEALHQVHDLKQNVFNEFQQQKKDQELKYQSLLMNMQQELDQLKTREQQLVQKVVSEKEQRHQLQKKLLVDFESRLNQFMGDLNHESDTTLEHYQQHVEGVSRTMNHLSGQVGIDLEQTCAHFESNLTRMDQRVSALQDHCQNTLEVVKLI